MERYRVRAGLNNGGHPLPPRVPSSSPSSSFPGPKLSSSQVSLPLKPPASSFLRRPAAAVEDAEISIFDAERYFNQDHHVSSGVPQQKINVVADAAPALTVNIPRASSVSSVESYGPRNWRSRSFRATPTASSEASWNSRSGLLSNPPGSVAINVRAFPSNEKRRPARTGRRLFGGNCPCYGKKSVDVEEKFAEVKCSSDDEKASNVTSSSIITASSLLPAGTKELEPVAKLRISAGTWAKDPVIFPPPEKALLPEVGHRIVNSGRPFVETAGFSFPILAPPPQAVVTGAGEELPRDSLEVFRPPDELAKLRRSAEYHRRPGPASAAGDDDGASDTSSDLFEIESFSTAYCRRDSLDELSKLAGNTAGVLQFRRSLEATTASISPSECYAPSEVSVEWSVTTAEGGFDRNSVANFSSAASDCGEVRFIQAEHDRFRTAMMAGSKKKGGGGGLLSCRCENSVSVGPNPVRIGPEQKKNGNVVGAVGEDRLGQEKAELVRSYSTRMSRPVHKR